MHEYEEKSSTFRQAQVWFYRDPLLKKNGNGGNLLYKENGEEIKNGCSEATLRGDRYVVVVQATGTISKHSVLVVPCSSRKRTEYDFQIQLEHRGMHQTSPFARITNIFPVSPATLERYICTLSDGVMIQMEKEIARLLTPMTSRVTQEDVDIGNNSETICEDQNNRKAARRKREWSEGLINEFLQEYREFGASNHLLEKYDIAKSTAMAYWSKWKYKLDNPMTLGVHALPPPEEMEEEVPTQKESLNTSDVVSSISKVANVMRTALMELRMHEKLFPFVKNEKYPIIPEDLYKHVGNWIYHSLLEFLEIKKNWVDESWIIPKVEEIHLYWGTWYFFDKVYHDRQISYEKNGLRMMDLFRDRHGMVTLGIDSDWITLLRYRLNNKINLNDAGLDLLCEHIQEFFCNSTT